jgi:hypothetical protein
MSRKSKVSIEYRNVSFVEMGYENRMKGFQMERSYQETIALDHESVSLRPKEAVFDHL